MLGSYARTTFRSLRRPFSARSICAVSRVTSDSSVTIFSDIKKVPYLLQMVL